MAVSPVIVATPVGSRSLPQALVVSGARGSGKSTFLTQLAAASLPGEIAKALPAGAGGWPQRAAARSSEWLPAVLGRAVAGTSEPGLVLHYDLIRFVGHGADDPSLAVARIAGALTIVVIRPPDHQLAAQFSERSRQSLEVMRQLTDQTSSRPLQPDDALSVDIANRMSALSKSAARMLCLYQTPGWIEGLYRNWFDAIQRISNGTEVRWLEIAPERIGNKNSWRVNARSPERAPEEA